MIALKSPASNMTLYSHQTHYLSVQEDRCSGASEFNDFLLSLFSKSYSKKVLPTEMLLLHTIQLGGLVPN